jgi:hypothetical protein
MQDGPQTFHADVWVQTFVARCEAKDAELRQRWQEEWVRHCNGKRLIDDIYKDYKVKRSKFDFKRRLAGRMKSEQMASSSWMAALQGLTRFITSTV